MALKAISRGDRRLQPSIWLLNQLLKTKVLDLNTELLYAGGRGHGLVILGAHNRKLSLGAQGAAYCRILNQGRHTVRLAETE